MRSPHVTARDRLLAAILFTWFASAPLYGRSTNPVYVEDSPAVADLAARADDLRSQERLVEAVRLYQQIIEEYASRVIEQEENLYIGAARWAQMRLHSDEALLNAYRRSHEPIAQRRLREAMGPRANLDSLARVVRQFGMCRSGLEAAIHLAASCLEHGRMSDAAVVLDDMAGHHDLGEVESRYHQLQAAVGLFGRDKERLTRHLQALARLGARDLLAETEGWAAATRPPADTETLDSARRPPTASLPDPFGKPLWSLPLSPAGTRRTAGYRLIPNPRNPGQAVPARPGRNALAFHLPVISGETLYVVTHGAIRAFDRNSRRPLWSYAGSDATTPPMKPSRSTWHEPRSVCAVRRRIVAVVGAGRAIPRGPSGTALVCLDQRDGREVWRVRPGDLDASFRDAFFRGTPTASGGRVYVAVRRMQKTRFQDAYLVAVDLEHGRLIWRRHLASAILGSTIGIYRTTPQWLIQGARIYVSDMLGVVACLDGRDGSVKWLVKTDGADRAGKTPRDVRPLLIGAGLVVPAFAAGQPSRLLDPQTGRHLGKLDGAAWTTATYFMAVGPHVLCIGKSVHLIDGNTLKLLGAIQLAGAGGEGPVGAAAITSDRVLLPVASNLLELDLPPLRVVATHPIVEPGNVVADDGQILIAGRGAVHSYMNWSQVYDRLKRQIAEHGEDPAPALAMAHVSLAAAEWPHVLEGADAAVAALRRRAARGYPSHGSGDDSAAGTVFRQLLWFCGPKRIVDPSTRAAVFDRLASVTNGPADIVAYHMSLGRFLEETERPDQAIEHYQLILMDRTLSGQLYRGESGSRGAALEAELRQAALIKEHPDIYGRYETVAAQRLVQLRAGKGSPAEFLELARQFPLSSHAVEALILTSRQLAEAGKYRDALAALHRAYEMTRSPAAIRRIAGLLVAVHEQAGQTRAARSWLLRLQRDFPGLKPLRDGEPVAVSQWLGRLGEDAEPIAPLPALELPLTPGPRVVRGRLLTPTHPARSDPPGNLFLLHDQPQLRLCQGPQLETRWSVAIEESEVILISLTEEQIVLYLKTSQQILLLDAASGKALREPMEIKALLRNVEHFGANGGDPFEELREFEQLVPDPRGNLRFLGRDKRVAPARLLNPYFLAVNERVICIGDRGGRLVAIDRRSGRPLWQLRCPVGDLRQFEINGNTLVVGGSGPDKPDSRVGVLFAFDTLTGQQRFGPIPLSAPPFWLGLHDSGTIVCTTTNRIESYAVTDGRIVWHITLPQKILTGQAFLAGDQLILGESSGGLRLVDVAAGKLIKQITSAAPARHRLIDAVRAGRHWYLLSAPQATAVDDQGRTRWHDGIFSDNKNLEGQWVSDRYVVLLQQLGSPAVTAGRLPQQIMQGRIVIHQRVPDKAPERESSPQTY